ncbi:AAA family ATPase [Streptomyces sp. CC224B]|uniref:AAA family ATPase n=1 Tax=Streptomyces sp. CC224B TaxID=3044571 RepID=UPI0024A80A10|nr:AAA family ATPase [Streptomyces sp. CC224B]
MATAIEAPATAGGPVQHTPFQFEAAAKEARPVRAVLDGPPGSGRTLAALRMAAELGESIAVIDTERGRSRQYADQIPFHVTELTSFHPTNLSQALYAASEHDVAVIDCWSAFWTGPGGHLEQVDLAAQRGGANGSAFGWREVRPLERQMLEAVMCFPGHVVATLRDKLEVVLRTDAQGRQVPTRVGLRPEMLGGIEYEVDFAASLLPTHELVVTKSSLPAFANEVLDDPAAVGKALRTWAEEGVPRGPRVEFLHRAYDPEATYESLSALIEEVQYCRAAGMAAVDHTGAATTLAEVISFRLSRARKRQQEATARAEARARAETSA